MKFVVDRRPSRSLLTDVHLSKNLETVTTKPLEKCGSGRSSLQVNCSAANAESETAFGGDDVNRDIEVDDGQQRQRKRQHSDVRQDQQVEFSAAEVTVSSSSKDTSDKSVGKLDRDGKIKKREKRKQKEDVAEVVENVTEDSDRDAVPRGSQERKKHKSSRDTNSPRTRVEPDIENRHTDSDVVLTNAPPESVTVPHHRDKKSRKKQPKSFVDVVEGKDDEQHLSSPGDYENVDSGRTEKMTMASVSSLSGPKLRHKKRSKISTEKTFSSPSQTARKDPSIERSATPENCENSDSTSGATSSADVVSSLGGMTSECRKEPHGVVNLPDVHSMESERLFRLVMEDDDSADKIISGSGGAQIKVPSTPTCELSNKVATSPSSAGKASPVTDLTLDRSSSRIQMDALGHTLTPFCSVCRVAEPSDKTSVDSRLKEDGLSRLRLDPTAVSESPVAKKSPRKMPGCSSDVNVLPSPTDGSAAGRITAAATNVCVTGVCFC